MTGTGRAALVAAAGVLLALPAAAQGVERSTITVADHLSVGQREETIAVYFGGVLVGTLHVDASHPDDRFTATVPAMERLPFALCGKLVRQDPDGDVSTHVIDNGGTLTGYADGVWAAITLRDVAFTLEDESMQGDRAHTVRPRPAVPRCRDGGRPVRG